MSKSASGFSLSLVWIMMGVVMLFNQGCHRKVVPVNSRWQSTPLKIDGYSTEWDQVPRFYDSGNKLSYDVLNDGSYIYVVLKAVDRDLQSKILRNGVDIWLDTSGKKKQNMGIRFPLPMNERMIQPDQSQSQHTHGQNGQKSDVGEMRRNFAKNIQEMDVIGLAGGKSARTTIHNPYGVSASLNIDDQGILIYESAIPLHSVFPDTSLNAIAAKTIFVSIQTNKPEVKEQHNTDNTGNSYGGGGNGMGGGGNGMGGGGGGMGGRGMSGGGGGMHSGGGSRGSMNAEDLEKQVNISMPVVLSGNNEGPGPNKL